MRFFALSVISANALYPLRIRREKEKEGRREELIPEIRVQSVKVLMVDESDRVVESLLDVCRTGCERAVQHGEQGTGRPVRESVNCLSPIPEVSILFST